MSTTLRISPTNPCSTIEMTHVVEYLVEGHGPGNAMLSETWFHEGAAVYVSQDMPPRIDTLARLDALRPRLADVPGGGNPVLISTWEDIPAYYFEYNRLNDLMPCSNWPPTTWRIPMGWNNFA